MADSTVYGSVGSGAVTYGLDQAQDWLKNKKFETAYPEYTDRTGPVQMDYGVGYTQNANPYEKAGSISQGMDWNQFSENMRQPVYNAYNQNLRDIDTRFSGSGLYGSQGYGLHDGSIAKAGEGLMSGLTNADVSAAQIYGQDLDRIDSQNLNAWKTGLTEAERQQSYDANKFNWAYNQAQNQVDWNNSEAARQDAYNYDKFNWDYGQHRQPFTDYLTLANGGTPIANQASANQAQLDAAKTQAGAASNAAWGQAIGGIAGGLLGSAGNLWDGQGFELFDTSSWW